MKSQGRMLSLLDLFTAERPIWTADSMGAELDVSRATVYRYVKELTGAGFLAPAAGDAYILGPRLIELDRQIRLCDPLLRSAEPLMKAHINAVHGALLLCSFYGDKVLCIHQEQSGRRQIHSSFERGRPMPLFRGATSKIILAYLPTYQLRNLMLHRGPEIRAAGLGDDWPSFRNTLQKLRRDGVCVAHEEVDAGLVGVSAAVFRPGNAVVGSLCAVVPADTFTPARAKQLAKIVTAACRGISERLGAIETGNGQEPASLYPSARSLAVSRSG